VTDDDLVPVSVRLGAVVPPEDPEDWTRPLTWVVALGMLAGPAVAFAWFALAPPTSGAPVPGTSILAAVLAGGAALTGATQIGVTRAWTTTVGAGLFGALAIIVLGVAMAGERQVGTASPTLEHAFVAALAGLGGAGAAAVVAAIVARRRSRLVRLLPALVVGVGFAIGLVPVVTSGATG
jgi:hypothetical protein